MYMYFHTKIFVQTSKIMFGLQDIYERLLAFTNMFNEQVKKCAYPAIENFLKQVRQIPYPNSMLTLMFYNVLNVVDI